MNKPTALKAHIALNVQNVAASMEFYKKLFGIDPCKAYEKYAKFDVPDPALNLTLNERPFSELGVLFHMGIQVASTEAVLAFRERWQRAGLATRDEMQVICGHALQDKSWVTDPDGINWEVFVVHKDKLPMFSNISCLHNNSCKAATTDKTNSHQDTTIIHPLTDVSVHELTENDWEDVRTIYQEGIATGQATFELEAPTWENWNQSHLPACRLIAKRHNIVIGWAALTPVSDRCIYAGVAEISVYVKAKHRGQGIGLMLLEALICESEHNSIWTLQAGIFPENVASIALHKKCGFREVGRRERIGKLKEIWRDILLLERRSTIVGTNELKSRACV